MSATICKWAKVTHHTTRDRNFKSSTALPFQTLNSATEVNITHNTLHFKEQPPSDTLLYHPSVMCNAFVINLLHRLSRLLPPQPVIPCVSQNAFQPAPREWAWTCWFHSKVGVHRHTNSFKVWSFSCGVVRIYNRSYAPYSNAACPVAALQSGLRRLLWVYRALALSSSPVKHFYPHVHVKCWCERAALTRCLSSLLLRSRHRNISFTSHALHMLLTINQVIYQVKLQSVKLLQLLNDEDLFLFSVLYHYKLNLWTCFD